MRTRMALGIIVIFIVAVVAFQSTIGGSNAASCLNGGPTCKSSPTQSIQHPSPHATHIAAPAGSSASSQSTTLSTSLSRFSMRIALPAVASLPATTTAKAVPSAKPPEVPAKLIHQRMVVLANLQHFNVVQADNAAATAYQQARAAQAAAAAAEVKRVSASAHVYSEPATPSSDAAGIPGAWQATATCEEGGRDDAAYGYFGIKEWNGFGGYPSAGAAPLSVQLAWEAAHGQGPPDAPGQCHSY